jgi:hypothetical protein
MKIALYQSKYCTSAHRVDKWIEGNDEYIRLTEVLEVEFVNLPAEDVVIHQVNALDKQIEDVRAEMLDRIATLQDKKSKLMAIEA